VGEAKGEGLVVVVVVVLLLLLLAPLSLCPGHPVTVRHEWLLVSPTMMVELSAPTRSVAG